jgi:hypothetical protein
MEPTWSPDSDCDRFRSSPRLTLQQLSTTRKNFAYIVSGVFTPVLAKHTKSFNLIDTLSVGGGQNSEELRAFAAAGRIVAEDADHRRYG